MKENGLDHEMELAFRVWRLVFQGLDLSNPKHGESNGQ